MAERKKFRSEYVKGWASNLRSEMPPVVTSGWYKQNKGEIMIVKMPAKKKSKKSAGMARIKALNLLKSLKNKKGLKLKSGCMKLFKDMDDMLGEAKKDETMKPSTKTLVHGAHACLKDAMDMVNEEDEEGDEDNEDAKDEDEEEDLEDKDAEEEDDDDDEKGENDEDDEDEEKDADDDEDDDDEKDNGVTDDENGKSAKKRKKKQPAKLDVKDLEVKDLKDANPDALFATVISMLEGGQMPNASPALVGSLKSAAAGYMDKVEGALVGA